MNRLKKTIPILSMCALAYLSGRVVQAAEDATEPAYFHFLAELFYFDARSLVWMLIGGAIVAAALFPRSHLVAPPGKPEVKIPAEVQLGINGEKPAGAAATHSTEYWIGLDEATTVTVEELSRIEEEAEVFLMMGRPDMAIKVLRDHINAEPDCKANVWFKLLDVYRIQGMRESFERLAQEINTRFNVALPTWEASHTEAESRYGLEHFPNLLAKIIHVWDDPAGPEYLQGLMQDNRRGERTGFHEEAFREMLLLSDVLEAKKNL